jgi:large subunit ribosomal protein L15
VKYAPEHFGKRGFKRPVAVARELRCINLKELDQLADDWLKAGKAKRVGRKIKVNLAELGYDKLLGSGRVSRPFLVEVKQASELAVSKLKRAGGGVRKL